MGVVADVAVVSPVFREAIRSTEGVEITLEQEATTESMGTMWILWVEADPDAFEAGLDADETVGEYTHLGSQDGRHQYRVTLSSRGAEATLYPCWANVGGVFMSGRREPGDEGWYGRFRFADRAAVREFVECCRGRSGVEVELQRLVGDDPGEELPYGLTARQVEILRAAEREGYFEVPRGSTLPELAEELAVTDTTVSESLRRAMGTLVRNTIGADPDPGTDD